MSRYKVKSRIVTCDICGKLMHARGIGTHKRHIHIGMEDFVTKVRDNNFDEITKVTCDIGTKSFESVHLKSNHLGVSSPPLAAKKLYNQHDTPLLAAGRFILCTELDMKILLGKICRLVFSEESHNLISVLNANRLAYELILDFERRFECKFSDIKMAFPNLRPAETDSENSKYISFADLSYSN